MRSLKKIDLRAVKILEASRIEGSNKLIKLLVDLGEEKRQIIAGIGKVYEPDNLIGKEVLIVANLEPRMLMGLESQGMILAAHDENGPVLISPEREVLPGDKIS